MSRISEVYGNNFKESAQLDKALYAAKLFATNIAHKQFSFRNEAPEMFVGNNMHPEAIKLLTSMPSTMNQNVKVVHISKTSKDVNMFPYLINGPVEYFIVVDTEHTDKGRTQIYSLYITPMKMDVY